MEQIGKLKVSSRTVFGNVATARQHEKLLGEVIRQQTCRYAIAPRGVVEFPDGRRLEQGAEITLDDLSCCEGQAGWVLRELVERGVVLEATPEQVAAKVSGANARFRIAPNQALVMHDGVRTEGAGVTPEDFPEDGELRILELVSKGYIVDTEDPWPPAAA